MKILKIEEQTYQELTEIRKEIEARTGESKTNDQVVKELIDSWKTGLRPTTYTTFTVSRSDAPPSVTTDPRLGNLNR